MEGFPVGELPYPDGLVEAPAGEEPSVGTEGHRTNPAHVSGQSADRLPAVRIPSFNDVVGGAAGEMLPVGAKRHGMNLVRVAGQGTNEGKAYRFVRGFELRGLTVQDCFPGVTHDRGFGVSDLLLVQSQLARQRVEPLHLQPVQPLVYPDRLHRPAVLLEQEAFLGVAHDPTLYTCGLLPAQTKLSREGVEPLYLHLSQPPVRK